MSRIALPRYGTLLLVAALGSFVWVLFGTLDVRNQTYTGYVTDGNNTIIQVDSGSPADLAGLAVGDYIRSIGGIAVEDVAAAARRSRPAIGEARTLQVERDGRPVSVNLTYAALKPGNALARYGATLVALLFLTCGIWAFLTAASTTTLLLAILGVAFSVGLTIGPYFASATVRTAVGVLVLLLTIVGFAVLTHFLLIFPREQTSRKRPGLVWAMYGPAFIVGLLTVWLLVAQPAATSGVNVFFRALFGLLVAFYFGTSLLVLVRGYVRADAQDRLARGLNMLLLGALVGLGPAIVLSLVGVLAPRIVIPGARFLWLSLGVIPVTFALAAVRAERNAKTSE